MEVGVDTYLDIANADALVTSNFLSDEATRVTWEALSTADKEVLLVRGTRDVDSALYRGTQQMYKNVQPLNFPRIIDCVIVPVNDNIKLATIEQAVSYKGKSSAQSGMRKELQAQGVKKVSIGKITEEYDNGASSSETGKLGLSALQYVDRYIARGGCM